VEITEAGKTWACGHDLTDLVTRPAVAAAFLPMVEHQEALAAIAVAAVNKVMSEKLLRLNKIIDVARDILPDSYPTNALDDEICNSITYGQVREWVAALAAAAEEVKGGD